MRNAKVISRLFSVVIFAVIFGPAEALLQQFHFRSHCAFVAGTAKEKGPRRVFFGKHLQGATRKWAQNSQHNTGITTTNNKRSDSHYHSRIIAKATTWQRSSNSRHMQAWKAQITLSRHRLARCNWKTQTTHQSSTARRWQDKYTHIEPTRPRESPNYIVWNQTLALWPTTQN